ncbi:prolyl oligopeptidase family serine peptidase [Streptomyces sp. NBC_01465]|uniref:prolyl oligopeptidase family serine peptidase n=1 Tax=Streptomyces sp. NBC_01465 TaxID=2903878 RepID=UPI002E350EE4|nr:prolyl oligopeptidase family serine peptidase [Streptomyces sp. NBC_01465]
MDTEAFPRQFARTRRFTLGAPRDFTVSPDGERVLFLRSGQLWLYEVGAGAERMLAQSASSYATDRRAHLVAYATAGALWTVTTDGSAPRRIAAAGPVSDPRPSPDGTLIAYVTGGALRVVRTDGTHDRPLAEPEGDEVTYGLADFTATTSIGRTRGFWWSPESDALLVARVDPTKVHRRYIADPAHPDRAPRAVRYPAAGTPNAETSLHLLTVEGGHTPVDLAFEYLLNAGWGPAGPVVTLQSRDQRTVRVLALEPSTGSAELLAQVTDETWVQFPPGTPAFTAAGTPVMSAVRGDTRAILIGDVPSPDGLQVREVLATEGERVLFTASDEPTQTHVWSYEPADGFTRLTDEPGVHTAAAGGDTLVLDSRTPDGQSVTVLRHAKPAGEIAVLTEEPLVTPRPVHLVLGERQLRSRLHLPSWYEEGSPALPVLLSPYAGPGMQVVTQARGWYTAVCQWFAEQGFAVLATDGRGTPGRGVAWQRAIVGDRLGPVLEDQIDALHAAAERYDALDLNQVAVRGWSFSGYLAAGAVLHRPDVFHAAVAGAAPTDRRLYDTYWEERFLGHPDENPEAYERSSLLPHAHKLSRPLMLVHGLADDNVHLVNTLRLSAALLAAGRPHTVLPLSGTGHLVAQEGVADNLLLLELAFLRKSLNL